MISSQTTTSHVIPTNIILKSNNLINSLTVVHLTLVQRR